MPHNGQVYTLCKLNNSYFSSRTQNYSLHSEYILLVTACLFNSSFYFVLLQTSRNSYKLLLVTSLYTQVVTNGCGFNFVPPPCLVLKAILFLSTTYLSPKHRRHELKPMLATGHYHSHNFQPLGLSHIILSLYSVSLL